MIIGIGNDIIEIERIEKAISKEGFKNKIYTQKELENIQKEEIEQKLMQEYSLQRRLFQKLLEQELENFL